MRQVDELDYPRHVHLPSHNGAWRSKIVSSADECAVALAEGYSLTPVIVPDGEPLEGPVAPVEEPRSLPRRSTRS